MLFVFCNTEYTVYTATICHYLHTCFQSTDLIKIVSHYIHNHSISLLNYLSIVMLMQFPKNLLAFIVELVIHF